MKRPWSSVARFAFVVTGAIILAGCSTVGSRIDSNRAAYDQLPPPQRALVSRGKISGGMSQQAVYIAWGQPQQKATGMVHGSATETWVYTLSTAGYGPYPYGYGYGGFGYAGTIGFYGHHGGRRFYGSFVDPYWDPFYYPFAATVTVPVKTVSFQQGRVVAFQYLSPAGY